jgi:hypothetical protein
VHYPNDKTITNGEELKNEKIGKRNGRRKGTKYSFAFNTG